MIRRVHVQYMGRGAPVHVGDLAASSAGIVFEYAPAFVTLGLKLSPFGLPLTTLGLINGSNPRGPLEGLHGLFADSLPDGWGRLLMDRAFSARGIDRSQITPLMRLTYLGTRTMGALTYEPADTPGERAGAPLDLALMAVESLRIFRGPPGEVLPEVLRAGDSPAGARPKIIAGVRDDFGDFVTGDGTMPSGYRHWLIKFTTPATGHDEGQIEAAYADIARAAGIDMPETHLFEAAARRYFGVARFDRLAQDADRRRHVHTLAGLLNVGLDAALDYRHLIRATSQLVADHAATCEVVRRAVFNVLAHNRDDHAKNHAFLMEADGRWRLTPAYDLTFSAGPNGEHHLTVAGAGGAPTLSHIHELAELGGVTATELYAIVEQVSDAIATWDATARHYGVRLGRRRAISKVLDAVRLAFGATGTPRALRG